MIALVIADHLMRQSLTKHQTSISRLREEIDLVDDMVILLLSQRMELVHEVGEWKKEHKKVIHDKKREKDIFRKRQATGHASGLDNEFIKSLYHLILSYGKTIQRSV